MSTSTIFDQFVFGRITGTSKGRFVIKLNTPITIDGEQFTSVNALTQGCSGDPEKTQVGQTVLTWAPVYVRDDKGQPIYELPLVRGWAAADGRFPPFLVFAKLVGCQQKAGSESSEFLLEIADMVRDPLFRGAVSSIRGQRPFWQSDPDEVPGLYLGKLVAWYPGDQKGKVQFDTAFQADGITSDLLYIRGQGYIDYRKDVDFDPRVGSTVLGWDAVADDGVIRMRNWAPITFSEDLGLSAARVIAAYLNVGDKASDLLARTAMLCAEALAPGKKIFATQKTKAGKGKTGGNGNGRDVQIKVQAPAPTPQQVPVIVDPALVEVSQAIDALVLAGSPEPMIHEATVAVAEVELPEELRIEQITDEAVRTAVADAYRAKFLEISDKLDAIATAKVAGVDAGWKLYRGKWSKVKK